MSLISLLVLVIVLGLVLTLVRMLPIEEPFKNIVIIIAILALLGGIGVIPVGRVVL
jgi:hypothetical protein